MNAQVGKKDNDIECIGKYSKGTKNENGHNLVNFCEINDLILTNTCFPHKQRHMTTWQQTRINKDNGKVLQLRKVIDFIMIQKQYKHLLQNVRTYQGTLTYSDHRILVTTMQIDWYVGF